ncbi:uncharacterized protein [Miscanthus floridulus]|uniref:uncharacterized protein n=1 Tax=Miscanthus floridulus TaxID=154761 RepID=UPI00345792C5
MKVPSMGSSATGSGRRECPYCHVPLVRIQSKQPTTKDHWFLTCPCNIKGDHTTYGFICFELQIEGLEARERRWQTGKETLADCYAELKEELQELKQTMDSVVADLWKLKVQPAEPKPELDTKKCHIVLDCSVVSLIFVGFVGVLIGAFVVAVMWK